MGLKTKAQKGEISIANNNGRIRLRWRYQAERYSLNMPHRYCSENMGYATIKAAEIKLDILKSCFDSSLEKYKTLKPTHAAKLKVATDSQVYGIAVPATKEKLGAFAEDFSFWAINIKNVEIDNSFDYLYTKKLLEKWTSILIQQLPAKMKTEKWAATTYNRRVTCLSNFLDWLLSKGGITNNPLKGVTKRKARKGEKRATRKPLSEEEILKLLNAIKNDTYCSPLARHKHSHYYPFLRFMFLTGVRNAEAVGLRIKHLDFINNRIEISETFARTVKGTHHAARISKGTKMENVRYLPINNDLKELLEPMITGKSHNEFVFLSPKGLSINDHMLGRRIVKPVLKKMKIGDRDLYVARHSFGTRAAQQGMPITDIAYLMGHTNIETTMRNYIHTEKAALTLPAINSSDSR